MANPPTDCYVDPSINANSGTGAIGTPYGDLQYALSTESPDLTNGNRFNVKAGSTEVLTAALDLTGWTPTFEDPIIFQGYTSAQGDGGLGQIDCATFAAIVNVGTGINWYDMELYNGIALGYTISLAKYSTIARCYIHGSLGGGIATTSQNYIMVGNRLEDLGSSTTYDMITINHNEGVCSHNYIKQGGSKVCRAGIGGGASQALILNNIISVDGVSDGITFGNWGPSMIGNTVFSAGGSGNGLEGTSSTGTIAHMLINNYVEGFATGIGYNFSANGVGSGVYGQNASFNNGTEFSVASEHYLALGDNEVLASTGIAKSGSDTYANRFIFFAPLDVTNMQDGGYPEA